MKVVILAGGYGTRLSEETHLKPKPMLEIGGRPILWHIMKTYSFYGLNDFVICCGYKGYVIKEYFSNYCLHNSNVTFRMSNNSVVFHQNSVEPWTVTLVDTGEETMTGGRLKRVKEQLTGHDTFCCTYGDGVGNIDIRSLIAFHKQHGKEATLTATRPPGRFGALKLGQNDEVDYFKEKPDGDGDWINGGFFVFNSSVIDRIDGDDTILEYLPMHQLARESQLMAYKHSGFWQPMDTLREKNALNQLWDSGMAPWKVWA